VPGYTAVTANDIVPQKVEISEVKVDTIKSSDYTEELELSILFTDPPDIDNKYHIAIWGEMTIFSGENGATLFSQQRSVNY